MTGSRTGAAVLLAALLAAPAPARGGDDTEVERRIRALEEENARLREGLRDAAAKLRDAAEALERLSAKPRAASDRQAVADRPAAPTRTAEPRAAGPADPTELEVLTITFDPADPQRSSALLTGPLASIDASSWASERERRKSFFMPGQDLGTPTLGLEAYAGTKVKAITESEVVLADPAGHEVRLRVRPRPKPRAIASDADEADPLLGGLYAAHAARDETAIDSAERTLIACGRGILPVIGPAYERERQFNVKVSLQYILFALEGKADFRAIVEAMHATRDQGEKLRLALMILKCEPADERVMLDAVGAENDPMAKKYLIRALGGVRGRESLVALKAIALSAIDRNLRVEAIRGLEMREQPAATRALLEIATSDQDQPTLAVAIRTIAAVGTVEAREFMWQVFDEAPRTNDRFEAVRYFGRLGTAEDAARLEIAESTERVYFIREKIQQAIAAIRLREGGAPPDAVR